MLHVVQYDELTDTVSDLHGLCGNRTDTNYYAKAEVCRKSNMLFQTESKSQNLGTHVSGESEWRANHSIANAYASLTTLNCGTAIMMDVMDHRPMTTPTNATNGIAKNCGCQGRTVIM